MLQETFSRTQNHKSLNLMSLLSGQQNDRKKKRPTLKKIIVNNKILKVS